MPAFGGAERAKETVMILEKLKEMVREEMGINVENITLSSDFKKDIGLDSLDLVEILMSVEEQWGIIIDDDETASLKTVGDVVALIEKKTK